jgi:hypothetical protein
MLQQHGVAPVSDSVHRWAKIRLGAKQEVVSGQLFLHFEPTNEIPPNETDRAFEITTNALEATDFHVQEALMPLLNGNDDTSVVKRIVKL